MRSINNAGDAISAENANWTFGGDVPKTFDDHVSKSVPFYKEGHELILQLADFFLTDKSNCYEIGCSTATLTLQLAERFKNKDIKFYGLDVVENMIIEAQKKCVNHKNIILQTADILNYEFEKSNLIISYYVSQFIPPQNRQILFNRMYESLNWGGALILFEKVRAPDARFQDISTALYTEYKLQKGYEPSQIIAKSRSLKGILEPFSTQGNIDLMKRAGFVDVMSIMKYICFEGFVAIK